MRTQSSAPLLNQRCLWSWGPGALVLWSSNGSSLCCRQKGISPDAVSLFKKSDVKYNSHNNI